MNSLYRGHKTFKCGFSGLLHFAHIHCLTTYCTSNNVSSCSRSTKMVVILHWIWSLVLRIEHLITIISLTHLWKFSTVFFQLQATDFIYRLFPVKSDCRAALLCTEDKLSNFMTILFSKCVIFFKLYVIQLKTRLTGLIVKWQLTAYIEYIEYMEILHRHFCVWCAGLVHLGGFFMLHVCLSLYK